MVTEIQFYRLDTDFYCEYSKRFYCVHAYNLRDWFEVSRIPDDVYYASDFIAPTLESYFFMWLDFHTDYGF